VRFEPTIDVFNVFNNNAVTSAVTTIGSSLGRPSAIGDGPVAARGRPHHVLSHPIGAPALRWNHSCA
jgi:hypothetical protein